MSTPEAKVDFSADDEPAQNPQDEDIQQTESEETTGQDASETVQDGDRADAIVGEINFGGAMVEYVIKSVLHNAPFRQVTASRGKVQRAAPIASLAEQGKIRHVGYFPRLEAELLEFTDTGYQGDDSPNRADAMIWGFSELFPGIAKGRREKKPVKVVGWNS